MSEQDFEPDPALTDVERLQLLQLLTRDAMARRKVAGSKRESDDIGTSDSAGGSGSSVPVPERWRLTAEATQLFGWQSECLPIWMRDCRGTIKVATGAGKTLFALSVAERLQNERDPALRLVVVVPTIPLMHQWHDELRQGNLPADAIGLLGGGLDSIQPEATRIAICVLASARDRLPRLVQLAGWAPHLLLIVDECHRANAEEARRIFDAHPQYTLGLSATPEQEPDATDIPSDSAYAVSAVGQGLGPIIYEYSLQRALADGLLTPFEVWHVGLSLTEPEAVEHARLSREITELRKALQDMHRRSRSKLAFLAWCQSVASRGGPASGQAERFVGLANRRKRLLYGAAARQEIALLILTGAATDSDGRTIVFHESIADVERLFLLATRNGVPAVVEHSQLPDRVRADNIEAFRSGLARTIVSAKSLVEGFNVPSADLGIIAASSGSVRQRIQSLGRLLRRKEGRRHARVVVLYIRDTQDEEIYSSADWELVVGVGRNRYFHWQAPALVAQWEGGLREQDEAPRRYRPPSLEVDVSALSEGSPYPGRADGLDLKVDPAESLRTTDDRMVEASAALVRRILEHNPYRRAHRTAAGHLIVRVDEARGGGEEWLYLGIVAEPLDAAAGPVVRFRLKRTQGRRHIARLEAGGAMRFALGADRARDRSAGEARDRLLAWIDEVERAHALQLRDLCWDSSGGYWLEVRGERVRHPAELPAMEFAP